MLLQDKSKRKHIVTRQLKGDDQTNVEGLTDKEGFGVSLDEATITVNCPTQLAQALEEHKAYAKEKTSTITEMQTKIMNETMKLNRRHPHYFHMFVSLRQLTKKYINSLFMP